MADSFGKYLLHEKVGTGGMAEVFRATAVGPQGFEKEVAIKRILHQQVEDRKLIDMMGDEARIAARISHPNIAQVFEFDEVDGRYYMAMEYVPGCNLMELLKRAGGPLPQNLVVHIAADVCKGLHAAHEAVGDDGENLGVIHRDISPQNIQIADTGHVKILDFGVAKARDKSVKTAAGTVRGKLKYMAPEQIRARPLDRRVDIYALGLVMYRALTGVHPFDAPNDMAVIEKMRDHDIPPPSSLRPGVALELDEIVASALAKDRNDRPETALALQQTLAALLHQRLEPVTAGDLARFVDEPDLITVPREVMSPTVPAKQMMDLSLTEPVVLTTPSGRPALLKRSASTKRWLLGLAVALIALVMWWAPGNDPAVEPVSKPVVGQLRLATDPPGAEIRLDGQPVLGEQGRALVTPTRLEGIAPGPHKLGLFIAGHAPWEGTVDVVAGEQLDIKQVLTTSAGRLVIASEPSDAAVTIDGKARGRTPLTLEGLVWGQAYDVGLRKDGFELRSETLTLTPGSEPRTWKLDPRRAPAVTPTTPAPRRRPKARSAPSRERGFVKINSIPSAKIFIDGKDTGMYTPAFSIPLSPGLHKLRLVTTEQKLERTRSVTIKAGKTSLLVIDFRKDS